MKTVIIFLAILGVMLAGVTCSEQDHTDDEEATKSMIHSRFVRQADQNGNDGPEGDDPPPPGFRAKRCTGSGSRSNTNQGGAAAAERMTGMFPNGMENAANQAMAAMTNAMNAGSG